MRVVIQRSKEASVVIDGEISGEISHGLVVLLGIELEDSKEDADWLLKKLIALRIFSDDESKMNLSIGEVNGSFLVISQFTLHASTKKGNRPSYIKAARPEQAVPLYEYFVDQLQTQSGRKVATGEFGANMQVSLINDGPVTIWIDSKNRE